MATSLDPLLTYFDGEKQAGVLVFALGVLAVGFSLWLWRSESPFKLMWVPLGLIGLGQLAVGAGLYAKTGGQVRELTARLQRGGTDEAAARAGERARMQRVNANFTVIEIVEVVLLVAGVVLALGMRSRPALMGVGMGLVVQAAVMLAFDIFAEQRGLKYAAWLG